MPRLPGESDARRRNGGAGYCFPAIGFAQHKGYPTAFHLEKLAELARLNIIVAALGLSNAHWDLVLILVSRLSKPESEDV